MSRQGFVIRENIGIYPASVKPRVRRVLTPEQRDNLLEAATAAGLTVEEFVGQFTTFDELFEAIHPSNVKHENS